MAYVAPVLADFKAYFPELADRGDTLINLVLEEAGNEVDETWLENDYKWAILWLAAHLVSLRPPLLAIPGGGGSGPLAAAAAGDITSLKVGDSAVNFASGGGGAGGGGGATEDALTSTRYGQRYLVLRDRSHSSPRVFC